MRSFIRKAILCAALAGSIPFGVQSAELLPVDYFARLPVVGGPYGNHDIELSPDGEHYAAIIEVNGEPVLASVPTNGTADIKYVRYDNFRPGWFAWANNRYLLISVDFRATASHYDWTERRLAVLDIETGKVDSILDHNKNYAHWQDRLVSRLPVSGNEILLDLNNGVFSLPISGGRKGTEIIRPKAGITSWSQDAQGAVRIGYGLYYDRRTGFVRPQARLIFRESGDAEFKTVASFDPRDIEGDAFDVVGFTEEPQRILISDVNEQGRLSLYKYDVTSGKVVDTIFSDPQYDFESVRYAPGTDRLISLTHIADTPVTQFFDASEERDQATLDRLYPGLQNAVVSRSADGSRVITRSEGPDTPPVFRYFDTGKNVYLELGQAYPQLSGMKLSQARAIRYKARDGLEIHGYVTSPNGQPGGPQPMIVFPHGGPGARDTLTYDYWVQFFVSRCWAVLQVNFRGSTGYGEAFRKMGHGQWGRAMQEDVTDGLQWAIAQGIADPARICIVGGSYGGYVALQAAASTPELYRCAVSLNGLSDMVEHNKDLRRSAYFQLWRDYLIEDDPVSVSPARYAGNVTIPVMIAYGTHDTVVDPEQSEGMVAALKREGRQPVVVKLEKGDHSLTSASHRLAFFQAMDSFLQEHLGLGAVPSSAVAEKPAK